MVVTPPDSIFTARSNQQDTLLRTCRDITKVYRLNALERCSDPPSLLYSAHPVRKA
jgi:hypothetical protein